MSEQTDEIQQGDSSSWDSNDDGDRLAAPLQNWNDAFQRVQRRIRAFTPHARPAEMIEAYSDLICLIEDFLSAAQSYGRIIISEAHLPPEQKTVQPTRIGGVIGGQKYLVHGILFKFSTDCMNIFGGTDDADAISAKISGHELKGLLACMNCAPADLSLPLIALVDYKGFRLIAMSQLPISQETLAVGSGDGGITVVSRNAVLSEKMSQMGRSLNLKGHLVGASQEGSEFLYTPVDLEGHVGRDRAFYLCDFSRMMPPETPQKGSKQTYLYQLLRREFVSALKIPLSSDAFSQFTKMQPEHERDNEEVEQATSLLFKEIIPRTAQELDQLLQANVKKSILSFRLSPVLHSHGVNVRHLFRVLEHCQSSAARALIWVEMVARVVVGDIRDKLRRTTRIMPLSMVETHYLAVLCARINVIFGNTARSVMYWNNFVRRKVWKKFCLHLGPRASLEVQGKHRPFVVGGSFKILSMDFIFSETYSLHVLFDRVQTILGFQLKSYVSEQIRPSDQFVRMCSRSAPFRPRDWQALGVRVKHMNTVSYAKGFVFLVQGLAMRASDPQRAFSMLQFSVKNFEDSLAANTNSKLTLRACSKALLYLHVEGSRDTGGATAAGGSSSSSSSSISSSSKGQPSSSPPLSPLLARADEYHQRAIQADVTDPESYHGYGVFLERIGNKATAAMMYQSALLLDPYHVDTLKDYGDLLSEVGRDVEAEAMYLTAREQSRKHQMTREGSRTLIRRRDTLNLPPSEGQEEGTE